MTSSLRFITHWLCLTALATITPTLLSSAQTAELENSTKLTNTVVKVFSTARLPDPYKPWARQSPREANGSGVVIEGKRILTNAHVVAYASQVQIQANQAGEKLSAHVVAIAPGIDLAVLKIDDDSFFRSHPPLERSSTLPAIKDAVLAYGFPIGGSSLSVTKGIVSRIEFARYHYPVFGLRIQIDAAINPGNSGGPVLAGDKMIGLAFSGLTNAQNIGYIIPNEEIELFLKDIEDGRYDGKPTFLDDMQTLDNPALRRFLKLGKDDKGIVVHRPFRTDATYPLKEWDLITNVAGSPVDEQGMIRVGSDLRLNLGYMVQKSAPRGLVPMTIVRDGKPMQIELPVVNDRPMLIPPLNNSYPPYFVYGPVVLTVASAEFTAFLNGNANALAAFSFMRSPLVTQRSAAPDAQREELVVIAAPLFPHILGTGYSNPQYMVVKTVNGAPVRSLRHLVEILRDMKEEFVSFETDNYPGETMVFPHREMVRAVDDILSDNGLRAQGSPDMLEVWHSKKKP